MSQVNWDRSTIGGAGPDASRRRMLRTAAAGLAAGLVTGAALAFVAMKHEAPQRPKDGSGNAAVGADLNAQSQLGPS
ncbi:hypothetical protein [Variovorax soli]|uniref:Deferrochelatase/peroxidase EfeB n=1 Tax=Variovorax soli TaxID=376815 RepID=A0ABU1NBR3_9BURK|nr:hypothetical protein [Variovorax soli]MDR6535883.1 hypothetical protein [Variovorax soli]